MNGIKMSDCKFYVDEEARTVVCVIPDTQEMLENFIYEHFNFNDIDFFQAANFFYRSKFGAAVRMPHSFMGKAVCAPEDEWNKELGCMIAFARAKDKCYKSFFKRANLFIQTVDRRLGDMIETFNDFGMKLENKREALQNEIDAKIAPENEEE